MYDNPNNASSLAGRRLLLAENFRSAPNFAPQTRGSVYDSPKVIVLDQNQSITGREKKEIQSSVHAALLGNLVD